MIERDRAPIYRSGSQPSSPSQVRAETQSDQVYVEAMRGYLNENRALKSKIASLEATVDQEMEKGDRVFKEKEQLQDQIRTLNAKIGILSDRIEEEKSQAKTLVESERRKHELELGDIRQENSSLRAELDKLSSVSSENASLKEKLKRAESDLAEARTTLSISAKQFESSKVVFEQAITHMASKNQKRKDRIRVLTEDLGRLEDESSQNHEMAKRLRDKLQKSDDDEKVTLASKQSEITDLAARLFRSESDLKESKQRLLEYTSMSQAEIDQKAENFEFLSSQLREKLRKTESELVECQDKLRDSQKENSLLLLQSSKAFHSQGERPSKAEFSTLSALNRHLTERARELERHLAETQLRLDSEMISHKQEVADLNLRLQIANSSIEDADTNKILTDVIPNYALKSKLQATEESLKSQKEICKRQEENNKRLSDLLKDTLRQLDSEREDLLRAKAKIVSFDEEEISSIKAANKELARKVVNLEGDHSRMSSDSDKLRSEKREMERKFDQERTLFAAENQRLRVDLAMASSSKESSDRLAAELSDKCQRMASNLIKVDAMSSGQGSPSRKSLKLEDLMP